MRKLITPRLFASYQYVYPVISRRSQGVSIGINLNIDKACNFDCPYCQVDRTLPKLKQQIDINIIEQELESILLLSTQKGICHLDKFAAISR